MTLSAETVYVPGIEITDPSVMSSEQSLAVVYRTTPKSEKRHPARSLAEAQRMTNAKRDSFEGGSSRFGGADVYVTGPGAKSRAVWVAHISYNGRIWSKESSVANAERMPHSADVRAAVAEADASVDKPWHMPGGDVTMRGEPTDGEKLDEVMTAASSISESLCAALVKANCNSTPLESLVLIALIKDARELCSRVRSAASAMRATGD